jgi:hypothetical protein
METNIHHQHRTVSAAVAGLITLAALLVAAPAHASRIPSDPLAFLPTPTQASRLVAGTHASNVRTAIESFWSDLSGR